MATAAEKRREPEPEGAGIIEQHSVGHDGSPRGSRSSLGWRCRSSGINSLRQALAHPQVLL